MAEVNWPKVVLVIGAGSIGERHIGIVRAAWPDTKIVVLRSRNLPLRSIEADWVTIETEWEAAMTHMPAVAIICTPTAQHAAEATRCLAAGLDVLVEKPIAHNLAGKEELTSMLAASGRYLQIAYMLRYHPFMQQISGLIASEKYGQLVSSTTYWGEYLPDWHPWEDYRESYAAKKELGGGAALTLSHDLDLVMWLHGALQSSSISKSYSKTLAVDPDVEAIADVQLTFENGSIASCHLSFADRFPRRHYRFVFDEAAIDINYFEERMEIHTQSGMETIALNGWHRNDMFAAQWADFCTSRQVNGAKNTAQAALKLAYDITQICTQS